MRRLIQATVCQGACLTGHHVGMQESQPQAGPVTLCVLLWARPGTEGGLIAYEDQVLDIASGYGGRVLQRARSGGGDGQPLEIQLLEFPSAQAVGEFMTDGRRQGLAGERDRVVARTEVIDVQLVGRDPGEVWLCCPCRVHDDLARAASCHAELRGSAHALPGGRRRRRVRRDRHGDRAQAGGHRGLRRAGQGRRPRRDLARQQLPGPELRRAVAAVLVLVPAVALEPPFPAARGDPGLPARAGRRARPRPAPALRLRGRRGRVRRAPRAVEPHPRRWRARCRRPRSSPPSASSAAPSSPDIAGRDEFAGPVVAFRSLESRRRPGGPAGGRGRHRGQRHPVRARDRQGRRATSTSTSAARPYVLPKADRPYRDTEQALYRPAARGAQGRPAAHLPLRGAAHQRLRPVAEAAGRADADLAPPAPHRRSPIRSCAPSASPTT